jgi:hypothetical protein
MFRMLSSSSNGITSIDHRLFYHVPGAYIASVLEQNILSDRKSDRNLYYMYQNKETIYRNIHDVIISLLFII